MFVGSKIFVFFPNNQKLQKHEVLLEALKMFLKQLKKKKDISRHLSLSQWFKLPQSKKHL